MDEDDERVGGFKQKMFSWTATFFVLGEDDQQLCTLKGKWTAWEFNFVIRNNFVMNPNLGSRQWRMHSPES